MFEKIHKELDEILDTERSIQTTEKRIDSEDREILRDLRPHLTRIQVQIRRKHMSTPAVGPVVLTAAGQTAIASVIGYDQFGNEFPGNFNPVFTASDSTGAIATFNPTSGLITAVANGVDSITATVTTTDASGTTVTLTDTETVTVTIAQPVPVLSTIKVAFTTPDGQGSAPSAS